MSLLIDIVRSTWDVLIIVVAGAFLFYLIDRFIRDRDRQEHQLLPRPPSRTTYFLKILVVVICLAAILQRTGLLPL
jgi:hypothetical protein